MRRSNIKSIINNGALIIGSTAISLFCAEMIMRWQFPLPKQNYSVAATSNQYQFYRFDPKLGWSNAPGMEGVFKRSEFKYRFSINEHGMRQGPVSLEPKPGAFRVAFLGDSFTWGIGVSDAQRYTDIIGKVPAIEALNFGVSGYGPIHYYLMLDDVIRFKPNLVVIAFTLSNDFDDNVFFQRYGYYKPYAMVDNDGKLEIEGYPIPNVKKFGYKGLEYPAWEWLGKSALFTTGREVLTSWLSDLEQRGLIGFTGGFIYDYDKLTAERKALADEAIRINKAILRDIKAKLERAHIPLLVTIAPSKCEYFPECQYDRKIHATVGPKAREILEQTLRELNIDFLNTVPVFDQSDFWVEDGHWNPKGHEKMARALNDYLKTVFQKSKGEDKK